MGSYTGMPRKKTDSACFSHPPSWDDLLNVCYMKFSCADFVKILRKEDAVHDNRSLKLRFVNDYWYSRLGLKGLV